MKYQIAFLGLVSATALMISACGEWNLPIKFIPGPAGYNTLVDLVPEAPGCPAGGVTFIAALDFNRSNAIEANEDLFFRSAFVCNGASASGPFSNVDIVDPCGDDPNKLDEVLLVLSTGQVMASLSDSTSGKNTRLAFIPPGTYQTTDGTGCVFTVTAEGTIE